MVNIAFGSGKGAINSLENDFQRYTAFLPIFHENEVEAGDQSPTLALRLIEAFDLCEVIEVIVHSGVPMEGMNAAMDGVLRSSGLPLDPSAANDDVVPIEDCGLTGCDGALRFVEFNGNLALGERYGCRFRFEAIADLNVATNWFAELFNREAIVIAHREPLSLRIVSNHHPIQFRFDTDDILWPACGTDALSLAHRVLVNSRVSSDDFAALCDYLAGLSCLGSRVFLDKIRVRAAFDEADLLRLCFF